MKIKSILTHDKKNDRVYLMKLDLEDFPGIINYMEELANVNQYSKIFAKIPAKYGPGFLAADYINEATIPGFFNNLDDALFLVKYKSDARSFRETGALKALQQMLLLPAKKDKVELEEGYLIRLLTDKDITIMISIFKKVFRTYPFPIYDPAYIVKSMQEEGTRFYGAFYGNQLIAVSSSECDPENKHAEMTDFAVLPSHRGKRLATHLLSYMEDALRKEHYKTLYTIARLQSLSMNKTFLNGGYQYAGTLTRNTQIAGKIESMNVWYKKI